MKKRSLFNCILALTLILSLVMSMFVFGPITSSAATEGVDVWDGSKASDFAGGRGTAAEPYLVENGAQLFKMVNDFTAKSSDTELGEPTYFKITKDIYLNDVSAEDMLTPTVDAWNAKGYNTWHPSYNYSQGTGFYGVINGGGHTVYGLYTNAGTYGGFIPNVVQSVVVENLNFKNSFVRIGGNGSAGVIIGILNKSASTAKVSSCSIDNSYVFVDNTGSWRIGGIVGGGYEEGKITVSNCAVTNIKMKTTNTSTEERTAPFIGNTSNSGHIIENCFSDSSTHPVTNATTQKNYDVIHGNKTFINVYTSAAKSSFDSYDDITYLTESQMKGENAKTNMPTLDYEFIWDIVENDYPTLNPTEIWNGSTATEYAGGTGTYIDPYIIENGSQLLKMVKESTANKNDASTVNNNYFKITKDIYLNPVTAEDMVAPTVDSWNAKNFKIWDAGYRWAESTGFCGNIDGDGHTIYGLYVESGCYAGFLANVIGNVKVTNLHFKNSFVRGASNGCSPAVIIGAVNGNSTVRSTATVTNCSVDNAYVFSDHTGSWRNGIIVGGGFNEGKITVSNCAVTNSKGVITNTSTEKRTAAFIGNTNYTKNHLIENCYTDSSMHPVTDATTSANYDVIHDNKIYKNVYTSAARPSFEEDGDITYLTEEQMKGDNAKVYMPTLSFNYTWKTVENGYPIIDVRGNLWDGTSVSSHADFKGSGTKDKPYLIENGAQLYYAVVGCGANACDGSYYKLTNDILLNDTSIENWEASAKLWGMNDKKRFNGTLDGDGHTIEGLYINVNSTAGRYGLIAYVGQDTASTSAPDPNKIAEIKNLIFKSASVTNTTTSSFEGVGIVAGQASGETLFENIYIDEDSKVYAPNVKGVAGIVARSNQKVTINNCAVLGTYEGGSHVSSFLGTFWGGTQTISNSYSAANVPVTTSRTPTIVNTYANVKTEDNYYDANVVLLSEEQMKGKNAEKYMLGLDFNFTWKTVTNGYPVLRPNSDKIPAWDGSIATELEGDGTKANPYKISNGAELYYAISTYSNQDYATLIEEKPYFEITADINLGGVQWYNASQGKGDGYANPNNYGVGFAGVINGNGYTIYNLYNNVKGAIAGLIPVATQGAEIYDLHLVGGNLPKVDWYNYVAGGLIGMAVATKNSTPIIIDGCSVENYTIASRDGSSAFVGDSYSQSLIIKDCYAINNNISHTSTTATMNSGAFVGIVDGNGEGNSITIENCYTDTSADIGYVNSMSTTYKNVYTTDVDYDNSIDGLTKLTTEQITGTTANANLIGLNFNQVWNTVADDTPVHKTLEEKATAWDGTIAENFASGAGTEEDPYLISNASELYLLANASREDTFGKYYKLTNDITISNVYAGWENDSPFSWAGKKVYLDGYAYSSSFAGTLDGAGYTVSGLYIDEESAEGTFAYGLIPFVTAQAIVKNINVSDVSIDVEGEAYAGAVAGIAHVSANDAKNSLKHVRFIDVNVDGDKILGDATRGVKFYRCEGEVLANDTQNKIVNLECNQDMSVADDAVIYTVENVDANVVKSTRKAILANEELNCVDVNCVKDFDIGDLVALNESVNEEPAEEVLVWSQEFNGDSLDTSVWTSEKSMSKGTTLEYADNKTFNGETMTLYCEETDETDENGNKIYSVNLGLSTVDTMSFKYGRLEMRAKIPFGAGAFPSLWLTSRDSIGYDPLSDYSTEIDVFEVFGKTSSNSRMVSCIHKWYNDEEGKKTGDECSCGTGILEGNLYKVEESDRSYEVLGANKTDWHTIVFEWDENTMKFSVDGEEYYTVNKDEIPKFDLSGYDTDEEGIFNQALCIRLNNHMYTTGEEAAYTYKGDSSEIDPSKLNYEIDYIRLYQKNDGKSQINLK